MNIQIERENIDGLSKETWWFCINENLVGVVDSYGTFTRKSKKHGWKMGDYYNRLSRRDSLLEISQVPFDFDIEAGVKLKIIEKITILKEKP